MVKKLIWDSDFFNLKIGEVKIDDIKTKEKKFDFDLLYVYSQSDFELQITNFENSFSEVKVSFAKEIVRKDFKDPNIFSIKELTINVEEIYQLAFESGKNSRFLLDKNFSKVDFERLYKIWVDNSISNSIADDVLIYQENNQIQGFVTYKTENKNATIGLIAVSINSQGKGIGGKMLNHLESVLGNRNIEKLKIPTQLENRQACNFYKKNGYFIEDTKYIKHYWKK